MNHKSRNNSFNSGGKKQSEERAALFAAGLAGRQPAKETLRVIIVYGFRQLFARIWMSVRDSPSLVL